MHAFARILGAPFLRRPRMHPPRSASTFALLVAPLVLASCGGSSPAPVSANAPEYTPAGETKCAVTLSHSSPLIVEWPSSERAKLESLARGGVVAVRYEDCHMKTLASCRVRSAYRYVALTPKHDVLHVRNQDELYASMPVYAASFEGKLKQAGELTVTMTIVGRYEAERPAVSQADLEGDCGEATHIVSAVTSGAFQFAAGGESEARGGASMLGAAAGGKSAQSRETLAQDGDEKACHASAEGASAPPFGCGAFLRLEVEPIGKGAAPAKARTSPPQASPATPPAASSPPVDTACPGGTHFVKGRGCVAEMAPSSRYTVNGPTVTDGTTKLTWLRAPESSGMPWQEAKAFCAGVTEGGGKWRLPTKEELLGLGENLPEGIDRNAFPAASSQEKAIAATVYYWSSTPHAVSESMAYAVRFGSMGAQATVVTRTAKRWVRCVR